MCKNVTFPDKKQDLPENNPLVRTLCFFALYCCHRSKIANICCHCDVMHLLRYRYLDYEKLIFGTVAMKSLLKGVNEIRSTWGDFYGCHLGIRLNASGRSEAARTASTRSGWRNLLNVGNCFTAERFR